MLCITSPDEKLLVGLLLITSNACYVSKGCILLYSTPPKAFTLKLILSMYSSEDLLVSIEIITLFFNKKVLFYALICSLMYSYNFFYKQFKRFIEFLLCYNTSLCTILYYSLRFNYL